MLAYARVVDLLHQLGVFVDQPRFSKNVGRRVLYLQGHNARTTPLATVRTQEADLRREDQVGTLSKRIDAKSKQFSSRQKGETEEGICLHHVKFESLEICFFPAYTVE